MLQYALRRVNRYTSKTTLEEYFIWCWRCYWTSESVCRFESCLGERWDVQLVWNRDVESGRLF